MQSQQVPLSRPSRQSACSPPGQTAFDETLAHALL